MYGYLVLTFLYKKHENTDPRTRQRRSPGSDKVTHNVCVYRLRLLLYLLHTAHRRVGFVLFSVGGTHWGKWRHVNQNGVGVHSTDDVQSSVKRYMHNLFKVSTSLSVAEVKPDLFHCVLDRVPLKSSTMPSQVNGKMIFIVFLSSLSSNGVVSQVLVYFIYTARSVIVINNNLWFLLLLSSVV